MVREEKDADYCRACAAEMMAKAQAAPSKAVRRAYLNLALNWLRELGILQAPPDTDEPSQVKSRAPVGDTLRKI